jgi:hypothetical protein
MNTILNVGVEKDHVESLTRASGINALSELIWNALDADSEAIKIEYEKNQVGFFTKLSISDDGHGLTHEKAKEIFGSIGGSEKKKRSISPSGRAYHGKEGKGRYKSLALGNSVLFTSVYLGTDKKTKFKFSIKIDRNSLTQTEISDLMTLPQGSNAEIGFKVDITNINDELANEALLFENRKELEEKFASYWISYPKFKIYFNNVELNFSSLIKFQKNLETIFNIDNEVYPFIFKVIEWNIENKKKLYLCNIDGIPFKEENLGFRSSLPISLFVQSNYIELLHRENQLVLSELNTNVELVLKEARKFAKDYLKQRLHESSKEFINELKKKGIYPYSGKPDNIVEESKRQVFDIVALHVHEHLPNFDSQDDKNKKLTLKLISEALENDADSLRKILTEVIELPETKREELSDLLENTSLSSIIDTMTDIKNRLAFLNGLEQIIYDKELNKNIKERKHLHKIILKETWIFGEEYSYGADDITLKNVLKTYLKDYLGREDFEEVMASDENTEQHNLIPDVCLWQQHSMGSAGKKNLVIELKKPSLNAGIKEKNQIETYASIVANDNRFPKENTKWQFLLITKDFSNDIKPLLKQADRKKGHIVKGDNYDVYVLDWGEIISEAKIRHEFLKEKLNINLKDNEEGINYLRSRYKEYLPDNF